MTSYAAGRILTAIPLIAGVMTIVFLLVEAAPGDPFALEPGPGVDAGAAGRLREAFGADRPLLSRYGAWVGGVLTGDLGTSFTHRRAVADLLRESIGNTLVLAGTAILLQFLLGTAGRVVAGAAPAPCV